MSDNRKILECLQCGHKWRQKSPRLQAPRCVKCLKTRWDEKPKDPQPPITCVRCGNRWIPLKPPEEIKYCFKCKGPWNIPKVPSYGQAFNTFKDLMSRETDDCILWPLAKRKNGYGVVYVAGEIKRTSVLAWEITNGREVPEGLEVLHSCDNPPCINPRHLSIGTHEENMQDAQRKLRMQQGERHYHSRLTVDIVRAVRSSTKPSKEIGKEFGLGSGHVSVIRSRKIWKSVP